MMAPETTPTSERPAPSAAASRRGVPALAVELRHAIMRTSRRIRQERSVDDVTPGQYSVLAGLDVHGPLTPREIAAHEKVQPPSMTRTLAALEDLGLVTRTDHPTDGRQAIIAITAAGEELLDSERRSRDRWLSKRLAALTAEERSLLQRVIPILDKLAEQ